MAFKSNANAFINQEESRWDRTAKNMAQVMVNRGVMLAPELTGKLKRSGRVVKNEKGGYSAVFGGADVGVPYARIRHFINKKNPQTLLYLEKAGNSVVKEGAKKYYELSR